MAIKGIASNDFKGLQELKVQAHADAKQTLPKVAKQFEALFLQMMLKTMRKSHFLAKESVFSGRQQETFTDMLDSQYVTNIADGQGIGMAAILTDQLAKTLPAVSKSSAPELNTQQKPMINTPVLSSVKPLEKNQLKQSKEVISDFVNAVMPYAKQAASMLGLDPKLLIAQAALETGWGQFISKDANGISNNYFNIKSVGENDNQAVKVKTTEYVADTPIKITASFKKYASVSDSFNDYVDLLKKNSRYETALANASNPADYLHALQEAGYATDPKYASKILSIYQSEDLKQALTP